jgi:HEAT repeat protein
MAFLGILEVVQAQTDGKLRPDSRDVLFALRGLLRIERDEANRARLVEDIRRIEHELAAPAGEGNGSPATLEQLLHALKSPDAGQRAHALLRLMLRKEDPTPATVRAIAGHVAPSAEPEPAVRAGAVRALGRMSGSVLAPLLRASIEDPDERVQVEAVDTLTAVARRDAAIVGAVVAVLGRYAEGGATERATAARQAVLSLTGTTLDGVGDESDPAAWRAAFLAWWRGPRGIDERVRALAGYQRLGDATPYQILAHYVEAEDFFVFREAVRALRAAAAQPADERQRAWYGRMPDAAEAALTQERWQASRAAFRAWLADAP